MRGDNGGKFASLFGVNVRQFISVRLASTTRRA